MVIEQRCCGWYFWYIDKHGARQDRGPWFTGEQAREESKNWLSEVKPTWTGEECDTCKSSGHDHCICSEWQ